jgi:serine/threonine protein kinase
MALPKAPPEEQFGPYEVYERLGVGGMATVHRAKERGIEEFERVVALKRLLPHLAEDASFVKAFVREAKLASMLQHVNIVQIFELGRVGSQYFISMEHIEGRDLRQVLRHARRVTGPPPIHITVGILAQLCDALDYAHSKCDENGDPLRIVHRDVSPSNLLVTNTGHLKVIDFGIAKAQALHAQTQTGRVKGKLAYMAPEAIGGKDLDCRSDLFAAGVIAHELLTARPLFASKNEYQTILKVQRGDILPPSTFNQACPPELDAIVLRALARNPDDRFASAAELRDELAELRTQYQLAAGSREISTWIEWAFSLEVPSGSFSATGTDTPFTATLGPMRSPTGTGPHQLLDTKEHSQGSLRSAMVRARSSSSGPLGLPGVDPSPVRSDYLPATFPVSDDDGGRTRMTVDGPSDEEEAAVAAWGTGDGRVAAPVELDDVPDVSNKIDRLASIDAGTTQPDMPKELDSSAPKERLDSQRGASGTTKPGMAVAIPSCAPSAMDEHDAASDRVEIEPSPTEAWFTNSTSHNVIPSASQSVAMAAASGSHARATFGAAMVARNKGKKWSESNDASQPKPRSSKPLVALTLVAVAGGAGAWWYTHRGSATTKATTAGGAELNPLSAMTMAKFSIEPSDAEIRIAGQPAHTGSPFQIDLAPGIYQVEIRRDGYKTYLTSLEMAANEKQSLVVTLVPISGASNESSLHITSTPAGAEIEIDGTATGMKTPSSIDVKPGSHVIVLKQNGVERWRQEFVAESNSNAEFGAVLSDEKNRERAQRRSTQPVPIGGPKTKIDSVDANVIVSPWATGSGADAARAPSIVVDAATPSAVVPTPVNGSGSAVVVPVPPMPPEVLPTPKPPTPIPTPPPPPPVAAPRLLPPTAVSKLSGELPKFTSTTDDMPSVASSKVCIDTSGRVTSVAVLGRLSDDAKRTIESALKGWRYKPFIENSVAQPACLVVNLRLK